MQPPKLRNKARCRAAEHQHCVVECGFYSSEEEESVVSAVSPLNYEGVEADAAAVEKAAEEQLKKVHEETTTVTADMDYLEGLSPQDFEDTNENVA